MVARHRSLWLTLIAVAVPLVWAGSAQAATCATLQDEINTAASGATIVLDSSGATGGLCNQQYTLRNWGAGATSANFLTITGNSADGHADGFDGSGLGGRILTGLNVHRLEIRDLIFRDGQEDEQGAAISISGDSAPAIRTSTFVNNRAGGDGGAIYLEQNQDILFPGPNYALNANTFDENRAEGNGGAVAFEVPGVGQNPSINTNVFTDNRAGGHGGAYSWDYGDSSTSPDNVAVEDNTVLRNRAQRSGGGGYVWTNGGGILRVSNELYEGNSIGPITGMPAPPAEAHFGGGLYIRNPSFTSFVMRNNAFTGNTIGTVTGGEDYGGGGLSIIGNGTRPFSEVNRYVANSIPAAPAGGESEGGGLYLAGNDARYHGWLDVIAANQAGTGGAGGGAYAGASAGAHFEFSDSTIAGNSAPSFPGLAGGDGQDTLLLENSIVFNSPSPDIGGFQTVTAAYSDACMAPGTPFPGDGNICADPLLVNAADGDIHQTRESPTIDKGNDGLFLDEAESACCDFEGDPRPTDGDGDGHTVDMGADETPAGFTTQQPPPPPPPPPTPQCSDGIDNDGDGAIDQADPGCLSGPADSYAAADANEADEGLRELVLCGRRPLSLVRADARGRRVILRGLVGTALAGRQVDIWVRFLRGGAKRAKLTNVTPDADGQFVARVKRPPRRAFSLARYQARVGDARSVELKLPQSLESTRIQQVGDTIELRGRVDRPLLGRRNAVVIKRVLCGQYQTVGQARPNRRGVYVVRFPAPELGLAALYRAETRVLARPGSKRYVRQFARAINITLTGQTG